jgi:hypothetical protein
VSALQAFGADLDQKPVVDTTGIGCIGPPGLESEKDGVSMST